MSTKKLAKELGLVRKRSQSSAGQKKPLISNQIFHYLIVIDFESTCWRERNSYGQEIIEFPAVLLNTYTGEVESEFHTYVQPQEHPLLSEFCTELTGITQIQVEAGVPLHICLSRFNRWLQNLELQRGVVFPRGPTSLAAATKQHPCTFVTWSDWDLGVCLLYECKRKQLHKPDVLNSWIDLRATYRLFYNRKPKGLNGALQDLGIKFSGREHSGLDDARNTAHLASRMMNDGCVMKITRSSERVSDNASDTPLLLPQRHPQAPLKTKPLFVKRNDCPGNQRDKTSHTTNDHTAIKNPAETSAETCRHLGNPLLNNKQANVKTQPSISENKMAAGRADVTVEPVLCQSIVSPKTLLNGLTTPLCGGIGSRTARIGTLISVSSPTTLLTTPPHHINSRSLLLVSTTGNIPCMPQPDLNLDPELGSVEQEVTVSVDSDPCGSYDDVMLEDCDAGTGENQDTSVNVHTENQDTSVNVHTEEEMFEVDDEPVIIHTEEDALVFLVPVHSVPGPTNSGPSSHTTNTSCLPLNSLNHKLITGSSSHASVSMTTEMTNAYSFAEPRPASHSDTTSGPKTEMPKPRWTNNPFIFNNSLSNNLGGSSFSRPLPVHRWSQLTENHKRCHTKTPNNDNTNSSEACSTTRSFTKLSSTKPVPVFRNPNHQTKVLRPLTTKNGSSALPGPSFTRHPAAGCSSNQPATRLRPHTKAPNHGSVAVTRSLCPPTLSAKITAPLCGCGRRAKRQTVCNGGPNHGRAFYGCAVRKPSPGGNRKGCLNKPRVTLVSGKKLPDMSEGQDSKKRSKKRYGGGQRSKKYKGSRELEVGMQGVLITCNMNERQCVAEAFNLLNEYADQLYGPENFKDPEESVSEEDEDEDAETALKREVKQLKASGKRERRFQSMDSGANNVIFIKTKNLDPDKLVHHILSDLHLTKKKKCRVILRMLPVSGTCKAFQEDMDRYLSEFLEPWFKVPNHGTYQIVFKARNSSHNKRDDIIKALAELVGKMNPENKVDLTTPELSIIVEVIKSVCCVSVVRDYMLYRKYNLQEVVKQEVEPLQSGGGFDTEPSFLHPDPQCFLGGALRLQHPKWELVSAVHHR
ncbi:hypothetical protein DPEC_G00169130 [Dallia pectoralis]|uniref:Uncharacterized protein n=1 Tax=Dallia pectoralis TaxID=75939 RepID=A0ACC2GCZ7_DALPE|nr:hypothetical protein DPEC_G00169130 [Dallia pectoralis]